MTGFNNDKVYTAVNADELKVGSKVFVAKNIHALRDQVIRYYNDNNTCTLCTLIGVRSEDWQDRFVTKFDSDGLMTMSTLAYLISEPEKHELKLTQDVLGLWEQTVCEIRSEIKAQDTPALVYAKELCDKLEHSMCALAGGNYKLRYTLE